MSAPTLLAYIAQQIISPVTKKGLFSDEYVLFGSYMPCAQFLYETGAILGYTFRDRLLSFVELFTPELIERLFSHAENVEVWSKARAAGLDIPAAPPRPKPIRERQAEVTAMIRPYIENVRPDLLTKLGL